MSCPHRLVPHRRFTNTARRGNRLANINLTGQRPSSSSVVLAAAHWTNEPVACSTTVEIWRTGADSDSKLEVMGVLIDDTDGLAHAESAVRLTLSEGRGFAR